MITFEFNSQKLIARIALLIAKCVGPKPDHQTMESWLQTLNQDLRRTTLTVRKKVGKGYFFLGGVERDALHNVLVLFPYNSTWGMCMIQSWVPGFNPKNPSNLAFPIGVSLQNLAYEHHDRLYAIDGSLGEIICIDTTNDTTKYATFCINLQVSRGWVISIVLELEECISTTESASRLR